MYNQDPEVDLLLQDIWDRYKRVGLNAMVYGSWGVTFLVTNAKQRKSMDLPEKIGDMDTRVVIAPVRRKK